MTRTTSCLFALFLVVLANVPCEASPAKVRPASKRISPDYTELDLLAQVYGLVLSESAEVPDQRKLIKGAINGMLGSLDPHSSYMDPRELKEFNIETGGKFGGIGLEVMMENGVVKVIAPLDDTPAAHAGILANDLITHINGEELDGITLEAATEKMRGKINTPVTLTILRPGREQPFDVKLTRDVIRLKPVKAHAQGDIGYLRISSFTEQTRSGLNLAMSQLKGELGPNLKGWIIDLRNDPGGLLDQAISVSNVFLKKVRSSRFAVGTPAWSGISMPGPENGRMISPWWCSSMAARLQHRRSWPGRFRTIGEQSWSGPVHSAKVRFSHRSPLATAGR